MGADRLDGLFAACADASDDLVRVFCRGAARRRRSLGESIGDRVAMEANRRGGLFAAAGPGAEMLLPEHRIDGLLGADYGPPDQVLALLDLRGVEEDALAEMSRGIYRRP